MKARPYVLIAILLVIALPVVAEDVQVTLEFSASRTLPALPVSMRLLVKNTAAAPVEISNVVTAIVKPANGDPIQDSFVLPAHGWEEEIGAPATFTIAPGSTLERLAPVDDLLGYPTLFIIEKLRLAEPGENDIIIRVQKTHGGSVDSNAAHLSLQFETAEDEAVWNAAIGGPMSAPILMRHFDVLQEHPTSGYYRQLAPFFYNASLTDPDEYAANMVMAIHGLSGAYVDAARLAIAMRYRSEAGGLAVINRAALAGEYSAKGRIYAQQLIDSPATALGPSIGRGLKRILRTAEGWQEIYNESIRPAPQESTVTPIAECRSANGDGTFLWKFGYESAMGTDITLEPGSKLNKFVPDPAERGQPSVFHPGMNHGAVVVNNGPANLRWGLTQHSTVDFTNVQAPPPPPPCDAPGIDSGGPPKAPLRMVGRRR